MTNSSLSPLIAQEINSATRDCHTELNRLIIARLPFALPPYSPTFFAYSLGLQSYAQIFFAFEAAWDAHETTRGTKGNTQSNELHAALAALLPAELRRTDALKHDLAYLTQKLNLDGLGETTSATSFATHIANTVASKPHLLVAYTWVMYMALFSGGRYIRARLRSAEFYFWLHSTQDQQPFGCEPGYSFFNFPGHCDGEDLKAAFKSQLSEVDTLLTGIQRHEIVVEAQRLFKHCVELVHELDTVCAAATIAAAVSGTLPLSRVVPSSPREQKVGEKQHTQLLSNCSPPLLRERTRKIARVGYASLMLSTLLCLVMLVMKAPELIIRVWPALEMQRQALT